MKTLSFLAKSNLFCDVRQLAAMKKAIRSNQPFQVATFDVMEVLFDSSSNLIKIFLHVFILDENEKWRLYPNTNGFEDYIDTTFDGLEYLKEVLVQERMSLQIVWVPIHESISSLLEKLNDQEIEKIQLNKDLARVFYQDNIDDINNELEPLGWYL